MIRTVLILLVCIPIGTIVGAGLAGPNSETSGLVIGAGIGLFMGWAIASPRGKCADIFAGCPYQPLDDAEGEQARTQ